MLAVSGWRAYSFRTPHLELATHTNLFRIKWDRYLELCLFFERILRPHGNSLVFASSRLLKSLHSLHYVITSL